MWRICVLLLFVEGCMGQVAEDSSCYGAGSIAASVIVTFIVAILLVYVAYEIWRRYWIKKKSKYSNSPIVPKYLANLIRTIKEKRFPFNFNFS